eukprot:487147-Rhodomonas_salina.1
MVEIWYECAEGALSAAITDLMSTIAATTKVDLLPLAQKPAAATVLVEGDEEIAGAKLKCHNVVSL